MDYQVYPGSSYPLGATWDGEGVNFSLFADDASGVELCLYTLVTDHSEAARISLTEKSHQIWHCYLPGVRPGQLYGYRVSGNYHPENGQRFNDLKLLIDPYAKAIASTIQWDDALFGYDLASGDDRKKCGLDSGPFIPKAVVTDPFFDWGKDAPPRIPYNDSIIYEAHVKGLTRCHPAIPEEIRGTYRAIAHPAMIKHLKELGITAIELMPVHHFVSDRHLVEKGLTNYWGYNTIGFFAPDVRYAGDKTPGGQVAEFKEMVKELHRNGIEVILDVVYNHTAEGNHMGPTLSFRGIDNAAYYRLAENKRFYEDFTGTGNTLNARLPNVLQLIMDSLRYWVQEMHVDGFRFDLASALARQLASVDKLSAFFNIIYQDPVISQVKLIAEPWDVGEGGYQVGKFPPGWAEWNGKYRDCLRDFWRGEESILAEFAERITGSADLYRDDNRRPTASINFVTAHDGFTLHDLVSYNEKHNEANGENNKDGESYNRSWNCGIEGETDREEVIHLRNQQKRNFIASLFLSQGVPMLVAGDELGHTQKGNNNAYCQDNDISWIQWEAADTPLLRFTQQVIALRKAHPTFCRRRWFKGQKVKGLPTEDIAWFLPDGEQLSDENWSNGLAKSLAVYLNGNGLNSTGPRGEVIQDDHFYVIFNAHYEKLNYKLPSATYGGRWTRIMDTSDESFEHCAYDPENEITVNGRCIVLLTTPR